MDWLAVVAVASIVGAVVAAISAGVAVHQARSSRRSAAAAQQAVDIDRERLDAEQTPQLAGEYNGKAGGYGSLLLTNHGPIPVDQLHLEAVGSYGQPPMLCFFNDNEPTCEITRNGMRVGEQAQYALQPIRDEVRGRQEFEVTAQRGDRAWTVRVGIELPPKPWVTIG